jgi:DNA polymerase-3 subunit gamma/tau
VDVLEIDGASNTGVDDVREIIENVRYQAAKSRFKVYIVDEVHMLSNSAFNALLKTLEEPPAHVKFIFATTDPHKLPATVQSRCQRYDFHRISLRLVTERLRRIVEAEGVGISDRALFMIAREGEGSMRDAQSLLDQVLAGASGEVRDADVSTLLGIADRALIYDLAEAVITRDPTGALQLLDAFHQQGYDMRRLTRDLVEHFRNLAVAKVSDGRLLPELPAEEATALREQADKVGAEDSDRAFRVLLETDEEVARSPYPKLLLEMALIKLATLPALIPIDDLLGRIEELETRLRRAPGVPAGGGSRGPAGARPAPRPPPTPPPGRISERTAREAEPPQAPSPSAAPPADALAQWTDFLAFVNRERPTLGHHLGTCDLRRLEGVALEIDAPAGFRHDYLARRDHVAEMEELARRFFERDVRVAVRPKSAANGNGSAQEEKKMESKADLTAAALGNPAVRAAVEILGGEVAEVRSRRPRRGEEE